MFEKRHSRALILVATIALGAAGAAYGCKRNKVETIPEMATKPAAPAPNSLPVVEDRLGLGKVAERVLPAVVSVASTHAAAEQESPAFPSTSRVRAAPALQRAGWVLA
jgi:hypothetical protein